MVSIKNRTKRNVLQNTLSPLQSAIQDKHLKLQSFKQKLRKAKVNRACNNPYSIVPLQNGRKQRRKIKLNTRKFVLQNTNEEQPNEVEMTSFFTTLTNFIQTIAPATTRKSLLVTTFTSSLILLFMNFYSVCKQKTKFNIARITVNIVNFIATILLCAGVGEETVQGIVSDLEILPDLTSDNFIIKPKFREVPNNFWNGYNRDSLDLKPDEMKFLEECAKSDQLNGTTIRQIHTLGSYKVVLPSSKSPAYATISVKSAWDDFRYPDWFLAAFWDISDKRMVALRFMQKSITRSRSDSFGQDSAAQRDKTIRELLKEGKFKGMDSGSITKSEEFSYLCEILDLIEPSSLTLLQMAKKRGITLPTLNGEWTEEDLRWPDWFLGFYTGASEESLKELREVAGTTTESEEEGWERVRSRKAGPSKVNPQNFKVETAEDFWKYFKLIGYRIIAIFIYIFDTIIQKRKFSIADLISTLRLTKQLKEESNDMQELYCLLTGALSPKEQFNTKMLKYITDFNEFMETPTFEFAKDPMRVSRMKKYIAEFVQWYNSCSREQKQDLQAAYTLYGVVNARIAQYYQTDIQNLSRQEPFLVVLGGSGGIGKTQLARALMLKTCRDILKVNPLEHIAEITPDDKYWPPLGGQTVALFDDAATAKDLKDDLLFKNLKGICAPTLFNAPGADVPHKTNPINFKIIFCTTNTPIETIIERITTMYDISSIGAYMRRMIYVECEWNTKFGKHNPDSPWLNRYDSEHFSHIKMKLRKFAHSGPDKGKMTDDRMVDIPNLLEMISEKESHYNRDFNQWLLKMSMEKQSSASHFSVVMHGRAGQGKTYLTMEVAGKLEKTLHMPITYIKKIDDLLKFKSKRKCIIVLDDIVRETLSQDEENILMDLYNSRLPNGSLILSTTNKSPLYSIPKITPLGILNNRNIHFDNEGLPRRLGYQGMVNNTVLPNNGMEIRCSNMRYYKKTGDTSILYSPIVTYAKENINRVIIATITFLSAIYILPIILFPTFVILLSYIWWSCHVEEVEINYHDMAENIIQAYVTYTQANNGINVSYVDHLENHDDYNLEIYSVDSENFMKFDTLQELDQHLFTSRTLYLQTEQPWKIYLQREILNEMQRNPERYALENLQFTEEGVVQLLKRYITAFNNVGIEPKIKAHFLDLGTYSYRGTDLNILSANREIGNQDPEPTIVTILGKPEIYYLGKFYTINQIDNFTLQDFIDSGMTMHQSRILFEFKTSQVFNTHPQIVRDRIQYSKEQVKLAMMAQVKHMKDSFVAFIRHPLGIVSTIFIGILAAVIIGKLIKSLFFNSQEKQTKKHRKQKKVEEESTSEDDETETEEEIERKKGRKGNPKVKSWDTDDDKKRKERKKGRKGNPKVKAWDTDDDKRKTKTQVKKEDVLTKRDMNDFVAYKPYFNDAFKKARGNLCMVYASATTGPILEGEPTQQLCYGLFIKKNLMVTVGHITAVKGNIFVGADEFEGYHRCIKLYQYPERDLSVWVVPTLKKQFCDISKFFISSKRLEEDDSYNAVLQRFAPGKVEEFHSSEFTYCPGPDFFPAQNGNLKSWGSMIYALTGIKVSDGGDCGLPYYYAERAPLLSNKIIGIHCMGNVEGYMTSGIAAVIFSEDIDAWEKKLQHAMQIKEWDWDDMELGLICCTWQPMSEDFEVKPAAFELSDKHEIMWHPDHDSTQETFVTEVEKYLEIQPQFTGTILKHSGDLFLFGSVHHSHTQFVHGLDLVQADPRSWVTIPATEMPRHKEDGTGEGLSIIVDIQSKNLRKYMKKYKKYGTEFRVRAHRYKSTSQGCYMLRMEFLTLNSEEFQQQMKFCDMLEHENQPGILVPFPSKYGDPIHVTPEVHAVLNGAVLNKERGKLEDIPYERIENNETVKVIGSFSQSKSHLPNNHYVLSPFSKDLEKIIPIEKRPCIYDLTLIPDDIKEDFVKDNYGIPSQLATLSVSWAHPIYGNRQLVKKISEQYETKIKAFYSGLRLLTDDEVLAGIKLPDKYARFLEGMELDTSIGFTMKQLFYVSKKSDVIGVTEQGNYYWQRNSASEYLQKQYEAAKDLSAKNEKYISVFTELLKMEKLKLAKIYKGRTFVAQDILGVLMERRNLGMLCARAYANDPNCGIGTDPVKDFNRLYVRLIKHPNLWAGDYKNFDRNTPAIVQKEITRLLAKNNPHMSNEIESTMKTNIERIQVCGTALVEVYGGMPSGCFTTAALNSLNNEYLMYTCFYLLSQEFNLENDWRAYNDNVERLYYGDDVIVSVSDKYKECFTRENCARVLKQVYGMTLDSSAKDGSTATFDTFETASWISRFFRKVGKYPFRAGALKKISIGANFHYVSSNSLSHLGGLMEKAQWEAAFWEPEYFATIQQAIQVCCNKNKNLLKYVNLRSMESIHKEAFEMAGNNIMRKEIEDAPPAYNSWAEEVENSLKNSHGLLSDNLSAARATLRSSSNTVFFEKYFFKQAYFRKVVLPIVNHRFTEINMSDTYSQRVNDLFTGGFISKPTIEYTSYGPPNDKTWCCTMECDIILSSKHLIGSGCGKTKHEAKEEASYEICKAYDHTSVLLKEKRTAKMKVQTKNFKLEMNVSSGVVNKTPGAPMVQADVNVVADSGLYTNTTAPSPAKIINSTGIALDNPAGSGAPFNKHVSVYNIYQRWESKNTVISPAMASGVEVLRLSLDPAELPEMISSYISFHESMIPELDITVAIAGANGTIGWLACGWVRDASTSKSYTLSDLQQVSMEETNMNGTQVIRIKLTDVRRTGLYRLTTKDPEPYPGVIFMIDQAVTNVQRNDSVNYPVRVQVRLGPGCVLMEPFLLPSGGGSTLSFNLGSYFYDSNVDMLVGSSAVTDIGNDLLQFADCGFSTKDFTPTFSNDNFLYSDYVEPGLPDTQFIQCCVKDATISADYLNQVVTAYGQSNTGTVDSLGCLPKKMYYAYGHVSAKDPAKKVFTTVHPEIIGSVLTIPEKQIYFGSFCYLANKIYIQPTGCILELDLSYSVQDLNPNAKLMVYTKSKVDAVTQTIIYDAPGVTTSGTQNATWFSFSNAGAAGDDYDTWFAKDTATGGTAGTNDKLDMPRTWVCTGNSQPSTNLPTGLKELSFIRTGTTSTQSGDTPFVPLYKPIIRNAFSALDDMLTENNWTILKGDLFIGGLNKGQIGYQKNLMFVRTDDFKKILSGVGDDIKIKNITKLDSIQGLTSFNTTGYSSWVTNSLGFTRRKIDLSMFKLEATIAGGLITGLGSGITDWSKQMFQAQMMDKLQKANMALQGANNSAIAERQRLAFQRQLELTGYQGDSSQHGTAYPGFVGPRREEFSPNSSTYDAALNINRGGSNFVYSQEFTPQGHDSNALVSKIDDTQPDMTEFHTNPSFNTPNKYQNDPSKNGSFLSYLTPNQAAPGVEPINPALDKENGIDNTRFVQHVATNEGGDVEASENVQPATGSKVSDAK